jgi:enediyne biosynthesis protein E4
VRWPSGRVEPVTLPSVDRFFVIEEGKGVVPSLYDNPAKAAGHTVGSAPSGN